MIASSSEFAVAQTLSDVASKREVLMTAIGETLGFPFSAPFRPPTELAATVVSLAVVIQGIRVQTDFARHKATCISIANCRDLEQKVQNVM